MYASMHTHTHTQVFQCQTISSPCLKQWCLGPQSPLQVTAVQIIDNKIASNSEPTFGHPKIFASANLGGRDNYVQEQKCSIKILRNALCNMLQRTGLICDCIWADGHLSAMQGACSYLHIVRLLPFFKAPALRVKRLTEIFSSHFFEVEFHPGSCRKNLESAP